MGRSSTGLVLYPVQSGPTCAPDCHSASRAILITAAALPLPSDFQTCELLLEPDDKAFGAWRANTTGADNEWHDFYSVRFFSGHLSAQNKRQSVLHLVPLPVCLCFCLLLVMVLYAKLYQALKSAYLEVNCWSGNWFSWDFSSFLDFSMCCLYFLFGMLFTCHFEVAGDFHIRLNYPF